MNRKVAVPLTLMSMLGATFANNIPTQVVKRTAPVTSEDYKRRAKRKKERDNKRNGRKQHK